MMKAKWRGFENVKKRLVERGFDEDERESRGMRMRDQMSLNVGMAS